MLSTRYSSSRSDSSSVSPGWTRRRSRACRAGTSTSTRAILRPPAAPTGTGGRSDRRPCRRVSAPAALHHRRQIDRRRPPRNQLRPLEREQVALVAAVARVVVLVAVDHHVRLGLAASRLLVASVMFMPCASRCADARVGGRHRAIGRAEALDVGEQHVAEQVAALQQRRRRDPGAAAGPAGDVRRIEQRLAEAAPSCGRSRESSAPRAGPSSCRWTRPDAPGS